MEQNSIAAKGDMKQNKKDLRDHHVPYSWTCSYCGSWDFCFDDGRDRTTCSSIETCEIDHDRGSCSSIGCDFPRGCAVLCPYPSGGRRGPSANQGEEC